jgi:uncharacterized protein (DUF1684 family)
MNAYAASRVPLGFFLALIAVIASCNQAPSVSESYRAELQAWRAERLAHLQAEDGWLSLVGLHWLAPGPNRFGTDSSNEIVLAVEGAAPLLGTLTLDESSSRVTLVPAPGAELTIGEQLIAEERALASDADGSPDVIRFGRARFYLISRDGRIAMRVKDPQAPTRQSFRGLSYFPASEEMRVLGRFEAYDVPRERRFATAIGGEDMALAPGVVHFELGGRSLSLEPWAPDSESDLFFVFRDLTSGRESYGAGRFLSADPPLDGEVVLDFNRAVNPPCAFTPYATCPLAPPVNHLQVEIRAGERYDGHH